MTLKRPGFWIASVLLALVISGCSDQQETIKIGATVGPHSQVVEAVAKQAKAEGINVEVVEFSDYISSECWPCRWQSRFK